jgi:hypothetical protein
MGSYFLPAIGQPSALMDIRADGFSEGMIPKWKELSRRKWNWAGTDYGPSLAGDCVIICHARESGHPGIWNYSMKLQLDSGFRRNDGSFLELRHSLQARRIRYGRHDPGGGRRPGNSHVIPRFGKWGHLLVMKGRKGVLTTLWNFGRVLLVQSRGFEGAFHVLCWEV